jgi:hypothetical protein
MTKPDKYFLETQATFASGNEKNILATLKEIKQSGQPHIIPLIIGLLDNHQDDEVSKEVLALLGQLKEKEVIPFIIEEINAKHTQNYSDKLIMTCWQSGLDYSEYIDVFTRAFIHGSFQTAIECFSVIEEWIHNSPAEKIAASRQMLIDHLNETSEEKKAFYMELIKLVESNS